LKPYLFGIRSYELFLWAAVLVGSTVSLWRARRAGVSAWRFLVFQCCVAGAGLAGAAAYSLIVRFGATLLALDAVPSAGHRYPGGLLAALAVWPIAQWAFLPAGTSLGIIADVVAPSIAFAMATVRIGCLLQGCCFGIASSLPWALSFPRGSPAWSQHVATGLIPVSALQSLPVEPLQVYFGLASLAVGAWLIWFEPRKRFDGQLMLLFLALHESGKFGLEFLREADLNESTWHLKWVSLAISLAAALLLAWLSLRRASSSRAESFSARTGVAGGRSRLALGRSGMAIRAAGGISGRSNDLSKPS
jgi:phosphatidylglycerol:prolipoprotein diacylglycerol transferase